jgi:hypothetical protein
MKFIDLIDKKFGRLVVIKKVGKNKSGYILAMANVLTI